jgi:hypothetical protein
MTSMTRTVELQLPFPPPERDELAALMRAAIEADVPTGYKLTALLGKDPIGPDISDTFEPCYRMLVDYEASPIEPLTWDGD